jgi:phosphinothricin acetyltransferase
MLVRDATRDDLPAIVEIYNHAIVHTVATFDLEPYTVEQRQEWFAQFDAQHPLLVCERAASTSVLGFACYTPFRTKAAYAYSKETTIYTHVDARRQGVGRALYEALFTRARDNGVRVLVAVLGGDNPASVALHEACGFERTGRLRGVGRKHEQWVDTHYFQKTL